MEALAVFVRAVGKLDQLKHFFGSGSLAMQRNKMPLKITTKIKSILFGCMTGEEYTLTVTAIRNEGTKLSEAK